MRYLGSMLLVLLGGMAILRGEGQVNAADTPPRLQFNGKNLDGFYVYLGDQVDTDQQRVFSVTPEGWLRISGAQQGYLSTRETLRDYRLVAEFKWGAAKPGAVSDSGIFFHADPTDKLWAKSLEVQMREGATGNLCLIGGSSLTANGRLYDRDCIPRPDQAETERTRGEWNSVELVCQQGAVTLTINDRQILQGKQAQPSSGRIYFQCYEGELFYRKIAFYPLP